ncbi:MAG: photosynthetic reaction center cytochrome PufC [Pseudomonadota bacterium]
MKRQIFVGAAVFIGFWTLMFVAWNLTLRTPLVQQQIGYDGVAMTQLDFADDLAAKENDPIHVAPEEVYPLEEGDLEGERAGDIYENVQVLGHLSDAQFNRFMAQITEWVSPEQGCAYCHGEDGNFAHDAYYQKIVARWMIRMTQNINGNWGDHVAPAGVNCYTCHRGKNNPDYRWFTDVSAVESSGKLGWKGGGNEPGIGLATLPKDPYTPFLLGDAQVWALSDNVHPGQEGTKGTKHTEWTYALMNHMSIGLGVNCTYCHNSRNFGSWEQSPPTRTKAWYGIRMVRDANANYVAPTVAVNPADQLGPTGDVSKIYCTTCHYNIAKPLYGADMISAYPSLQAPGPQPWPTEDALMLDPKPEEARLETGTTLQ